MAAEVSSAAITKRIRRAFIYFPHVTYALARLEEMFAEGPSGFEPEHLMLVGETGTGKSTLLQHFAQQHPRVEHAEFTEVPVLVVEVPPKCSNVRLAQAMLKALGSKFWNKGNEMELSSQLQELLIECKVRLVILDEINHLVDRGTAKSHHSVADWIKALFNAVKIPCVLAGIPRAKLLLETNDQLGDRFREIVEVTMLSVGKGRDGIARSALKAFSGLLTELDCIELSSPDVTRLLVFATGGRLRPLRKLLVRSVEHAFRKGDRRIDLAVLAKAFAEVVYPNAPEDRNPFLPTFNGVPLTKKSEPFAVRSLEAGAA